MLRVATEFKLALPQKRALLVFVTVGESGGVGVEGAVARAGCGWDEGLSRVMSPNGSRLRPGCDRGEEEPLRCLGGSRRCCGWGGAVAARVECRS